MSEVKRYNCTNGKAQYCYGCYQMDEDGDGIWVRASDFDAAEQRNAKQRELLRRSLNMIRGMHYEEFEAEICEMLNNKPAESGVSE